MAYLRASNYYRTAFAPFFGHPLDKDAVMPLYKAMASSFSNAAKLFDPPFIPLEIPFKGVSLRGYLANASAAASPKNRLLIVIGGYDAPMEEIYFFIGHHALSRGYSVLIFDGPGQGGTLLEAGVKLSHVYDEVLVSVLDTAAQHGSWKHTVVEGLSLGGLLCLQAVASSTTQSRVHAVVADPGELNLLDAFRGRLPFPQSICDQLPEGPGWAAMLLGFILGHMAAGNSMPGWALRRGMLVHACDTPMEYVRSLAAFDNQSALGQVKIPALITRAEGDEIAAQAETVYERLVSTDKKCLMRFTDEDGAAEHCETGARAFFNEKVFTWLDNTLYGAS
jgi:pimeloyl-ACP methyl ester carboxylesterase